MSLKNAAKKVRVQNRRIAATTPEELELLIAYLDGEVTQGQAATVLVKAGIITEGSQASMFYVWVTRVMKSVWRSEIGPLKK